MALKQTNLALSEEILTKLDERKRISPPLGKNEISRSEALRRDLDSFWHILDYAMQKNKQTFYKNEAEFLLNIYSVCRPSINENMDFYLKKGIYWDVAMFVDDNMGELERFDINKDDFFNKILSIESIQKYAFVNWAEWMLSKGKQTPEENAEMWKKELGEFLQND